MGWLQNLGGLLNQYAGGAASQNEADVHQHFDQVAAAAPQSVLAQALSATFRSDSTPPFGDLAAQLFSNSSGAQRATVLTSLVAAASPGILSKLSSQYPGLAGILGSGGSAVSPEAANQVPPDVVQQLAAHAESKDSSIVDTVSGIYAAHPALIKTLGTAVVGFAMSRIAQQHNG
jgi:hypothetical protein